MKQICAYQKWGHQKALQYLIKWKGYPESDNTWENANQIHAPALIKLYHQTSTSDSIKAWGIQLKQHPLPILSPPKAFTRSTPLLPTILRDTTATLVWSNVHKDNIRLACSPPLDPQVQSPSTLTPHTMPPEFCAILMGSISTLQTSTISNNNLLYALCHLAPNLTHTCLPPVHTTPQMNHQTRPSSNYLPNSL